MKDNETITAIYNKHWDRLMRTAYKELEDYYMSQDVVQDVLLKFAMMTNVDRRTEQALLVRMTKNKAIDYRRKFCRGDTVSMETEKLEFRKHGIFDGLEARKALEYDCEELGSRVFNEMKKRNIVWYQIMVGLYIYRDEPETVARRLGLTLPHMRTSLSRARAWVRSKFGKEYQEIGIISGIPESEK